MRKRVVPSSRVVEEESSSGDRCYPNRLRRSLSEWWKNHIMTLSNEEHANVALLDGPLTIREALLCVDANK